MGGGWEIAQLNVGRAVAPMDAAPMAGFMARLDEINALAERSPGFVWRLQGESGNNTDLKVTGDPLFIVNLSVWTSLEELHAFTYRSDHRTVFARRYEWFERRDGPNTVIWWQPAGTIPGTVDALRRLHLLEARARRPRRSPSSSRSRRRAEARPAPPWSHTPTCRVRRFGREGSRVRQRVSSRVRNAYAAGATPC